MFKRDVNAFGYRLTVSLKDPEDLARERLENELQRRFLSEMDAKLDALEKLKEASDRYRASGGK